MFALNSLKNFALARMLFALCLFFAVLQCSAPLELNSGEEHYHREKSRLDDTPLEWRNPRWRAEYEKRIRDYLNRRGYEDIRYASMKMHLYVVREGAYPSTEEEVDLELLKTIYMGWTPISINPILFRVGLWVRDVVICEIVDNGADAYDFDGDYDNWIYGGTEDYRLRVPIDASREYGCEYEGEYTVAKGEYFRVLWSKYPPEDILQYSISIAGYLQNRMAHDHGRNIVAHEIGHNFGLPHSDQIFKFPCNASVWDESRVMYSTILSVAANFSPCEVAVVRANIECFMDSDNNNCANYPDKTIRWEDPPAEALRLANLWRSESYTPFGVAQEYIYDPDTKLPIVPRSREYPFFSQRVWSSLPQKLKKKEEYTQNGIDMGSPDSPTFIKEYYHANHPKALPVHYCHAFLKKGFLPFEMMFDYYTNKYSWWGGEGTVYSRTGNLSYRTYCHVDVAWGIGDRADSPEARACYICKYFYQYDRSPSEINCTKRFVNITYETNGMEPYFTDGEINCNVADPN